MNRARRAGGAVLPSFTQSFTPSICDDGKNALDPAAFAVASEDLNVRYQYLVT